MENPPTQPKLLVPGFQQNDPAVFEPENGLPTQLSQFLCMEGAYSSCQGKSYSETDSFERGLREAWSDLDVDYLRSTVERN